jgi:hypothetical protein
MKQENLLDVADYAVDSLLVIDRVEKESKKILVLKWIAIFLQINDAVASII